jgi:hypothetical protein
MKTKIGMLVLLVSAFAAADDAIQAHLPCDKKADCKTLVTSDGKKLEVIAQPAFSFNANNVAQAWLGSNDGQETLTIQLTTEAANQFEQLTRENTDKTLALALGDHVLQAPVIKTAIPGGRLMIESGLDQKTTLPSQIPWLREKISEVEAAGKRRASRDVVIYAVIAVMVVGGALAYAFRSNRRLSA